MSEEEVKRKMNNAVDTLANQFPSKIFKTIKIRDATCPFHLEVFRDDDEKGSEVFKFRVVLGEITEIDKKLCRNYKMPHKLFTKVIACKKGGRGEFEYFTISDMRKH